MFDFNPVIKKVDIDERMCLKWFKYNLSYHVSPITVNAVSPYRIYRQFSIKF